MEENLKFCKFCGEKIPMDAVICTKCGRQVEELKGSDDRTIVINNNASASANNTMDASALTNQALKNKWVAFWLCLFLGSIGGHKFYEGKYILGILYVCFCWTGASAILALIDLVVILTKPKFYSV